MKSWLKYFIERYYPQVSLPLIVGLTLSAKWITGSGFNSLTFVISCLSIFYLTFYLRLKNDYEDFERDRIAFPERALPRGLISRYEVREVIKVFEFGTAIFFGLVFVLYPPETKLALLLLGGYVWLMMHKFYAEKWVKRHLIVKEIATQGFYIVLTIFVVSLWNHKMAFSLASFSYSLIVFGAAFVYGICRKLDPFSHPVTLSFVHYYGFHTSYYIAIIGLLISAFGAYGLGVYLWLWPCEAGVWFFLSRLFKRPKSFRPVKIAALLSLFVHVWVGLFFWSARL